METEHFANNDDENAKIAKLWCCTKIIKHGLWFLIRVRSIEWEWNKYFFYQMWKLITYVLKAFWDK